ncbi:MAG TPA: DUF3105 domain-containing protein [Chloroflexia bacterium]|nr:DUF3105 domain-containing protein [Chloroflexia bacterium]
MSRNRPPPPASATSPGVRVALGAGVLVIVLLAGLIIWLLLTPAAPNSGPVAQNPPTPPPATASVGMPPAGTAAATPVAGSPVPAIPGLTAVTDLGQEHVTEPYTYAEIPPLGGPHFAEWQDCGVYTAPVSNERAVHSMEHGAIWITYQPNLPASQLTVLQTLTRESGYRLLSPYPGLPHPIVASAWGYQLPLERADDPALRVFMAAFEQDPNGPEPGAPCSGSRSTP